MEDLPRHFVQQIYAQQGCHSCYRLECSKRNANPFFVATLQTGDVMIGELQSEFAEGYAVFTNKQHVKKPIELEEFTRRLYHEEVDFVDDAVEKAFKPPYSLWVERSDSHGHLHVHMYPRQKERLPPIIRFDRKLHVVENARYEDIERYIPTSEKLKELRSRLLQELKTQPIQILRTF